MKFDAVIYIFDLLKSLVIVTIPIWLPWYMRKRDERIKPKVYHDNNKIFDIDKKVQKRLDLIKAHMSSQRCAIWLFSNGGKYYNGLPNQRISCYLESNSDDYQDLRKDFQRVPTNILGRFVNCLGGDVHYHLCIDESIYDDDLSKLNSTYGVSGTAMFKVFNEAGVWAGILSVCFKSKDRDITEGEIQYLKNQSREIGNIINYIE